MLKWVDVYVKPQIDDKQYGGMAGTCTTDALVEMLHKRYESTDVTGNFVRVLFLDYSKAFDLINHDILLNKMVGMEVPAHLVRWMAAFLLELKSATLSKPGYPNGGVTQGTLSGPKHFLVHINDLQAPCPIYKYATKTWYLLSRILLTLLRNGLVIMTCVSITLRPKKWLYVSEETEHLT